MTGKSGSSARQSNRIIVRRVIVKKDPVKFSKVIVTLCIAFMILYTLLHTYLDYVHAVEISPTLTTCVFTFFGTELVSSAMIKIFDKNTTDTKDRQEDIDG